MFKNIVIIGSSGAIGGAVLKNLKANYPNANFYGFSSKNPSERIAGVYYGLIDYNDEKSFELAAEIASESSEPDLIIVATGQLHNENMMPEKSIKELSAEKFNMMFHANSIIPALIAKYFIAKLPREKKSVMAFLSARAGSISDNQLGGWYSYRASKAALNMIVKNLAIEVSRKYAQAILVALHPGSVESELSKPFSANKHSFSPSEAARNLIKVVENLETSDSGKFIAYDSEIIEP